MFTIGYAGLDFDQFIAILRSHRVKKVVDVRSIAISNRFPRFSQRELKNDLEGQGIAYEFMGDCLGARWSEENVYSNNLAVYSKIAESSLFLTGINRLLSLPNLSLVSLLCAEKDPLRCHRAILVGRHLGMRGVEMMHIFGNELQTQGKIEKRLIQKFQLDRLSLFGEIQDQFATVNEAYTFQGTEICYNRSAELSPQATIDEMDP